VLGIRLVHSRPGQPQGRGKIERVFRTVREQFLVELQARGGAADLDELNRLFGAWVEGVYHHREHAETGQAPMERFLAGEVPPLRCGQAPLIAVGDGSTSVRRWVDGLLLVSRDAVHLPNFEFATGIPC